MILEWKVEDGKLMGKVLKPPLSQFEMYEIISHVEALRGGKQVEEKPVAKSEWRLIEPKFDGARLRFKMEHGEGVYATEMQRKDAAFEGPWQIEGSVIKGTIKMIQEH